MLVAGVCSPACALDCGRLEAPRLNYRLSASSTLNGQVSALIVDGSRAEITIIRLRSADGTLDVLNEMRDFAPARTVNGLTGDTWTFTLRPYSGSISGFEAGSEAVYDQTMLAGGKTLRTERVTQKVSAPGVKNISGCNVPVIGIERVFEDTAAKTSRKQEFQYAPSLGYPLWMRIETPAAAGPAVQIIEVTAIEFDADAPKAK